MTLPTSSPNRRHFLTAAAGAVALSQTGFGSRLFADAKTEAAPESVVAELYQSLSDAQKKVICLPWNDARRSKINPNWHVTAPEFGDDFYSKSQRAMVDRIVKGLTTEEGYDRLKFQMADDSGGIDFYSAAIFGTPGEKPFEFMLTGRHLTLRADGNSVDKAAFGGPIVYGHGIEDAKDNLFYDHTLKANEVFACLDETQAAAALLKTKAPRETAVQVQDKAGSFNGLALKELQKDQKKVVRAALKHLLSLFREADQKEVMELLKASGGVNSLHMAFYSQGDLDNDRIWDIWRVEGPGFVWHFRGAPHVHAYINIAAKTA